MLIDEMGEYLVLKGFRELDSSRFKKGNTMVTFGVRGGYENFKVTESGEQTHLGSGYDQLIKVVK